MKLGFALPIVGPAVSGAAGLSAFCRGLEDLGYDTLWVGDRLVTPVDMHSTYPGKEQPYPPQMTRYLDPVLLWTVAATATSRMRLNASTLSTFYYEPAHLARLLTTLDVLSDGRLEVGVGLGWMKDEYDIVRGADWPAGSGYADRPPGFLPLTWHFRMPARCPHLPHHWVRIRTGCLDAEGVGDPLVRAVSLPVDAARVDLQQDGAGTPGGHEEDRNRREDRRDGDR